MRILLADDRTDRLERWMRKLETVQEVEPFLADIIQLTGSELDAEISELSARRAASRRGDERDEGESRFDTADLAILDYDLTDLEAFSAETGIGLSYLARCFSDCGLIVALNQFGENPFDLSGLGDYTGFADVDLGGGQLGNRRLWGTDAEWPQWQPWVWPVLPLEVERLRSLCSRVQEVGLDARIFEVLGLDGRVLTALAPEAASPLGDLDPAAATFATFLAEPSMGLRRGDVVASDERRAKTAAARVTQWFERWILAGQDRLIDSAHLAVRYPSQVEDWAQVARGVAHGPAGGLKHEFLDAHRLDPAEWLTRPAWWAASLAGDERIPEVADPWGVAEEQRVFCEDTGEFVDANEAVPYRIEIPADSRVRYVRRLENADYRPIANFVQT